MRAKEYALIGFRPNEKTRTYLEGTGFIDGRHGRKKDKTKNINRLINYAVQYFFEHGSPGFLDVLDGKTLKKMYLERMISMKQEEMREIAKDMRQHNKELLELDGRDMDAEEAALMKQARIKTELHKAGVISGQRIEQIERSVE
jgi:hypothetical protein